MTPTITGRKFTVITKLMNRWSVVRAAVGLIAAGLALACTDSQAPSVSDTGPSPFLVSSPVPDPSPSSSGAGTGRLSATVVYVSLPPGAIPNGVSATIRDLRSGSSVIAPVVNGGFDPIALSAVVGDTLAIAIQTAEGDLSSFLSVVAGGTRATVVRTDPPSHKRDVPLNGIMVIVFSEPIDPASLTPGSIQLWRQTTPVPGQLASADPAHLAATFSPDAPLAGLTDYELRVTQAVRGFDGVPLKAPVSVPFTTQAAGAGPLFTVGGTISGLTGSGLVLLNNGGDPLTVSANGLFTFATALASGADYRVTVFAQPANPTQRCTVLNGSGTIVSANVDIAIACTTGPATGLVFASVSVGFWDACGVTTSGAAYCWGDNLSGALGDGTTTNSAIPVPVAGGLTFASVSAGFRYTCGVTTTGELYCWGGNYMLPFATGGAPSPTIPVPVAPGLAFASVSAGSFYVCGITPAGAAYCWGDAVRAGYGEPYAPGFAPVPGGFTFAEVSAGYSQTCGVTTLGAAYCWGFYGALGSGDSFVPELCTGFNNLGEPYSTACSHTPVAVAGGLTFRQISAEGNSTCGLTTSGSAYCWGENFFGWLGTGSDTSPLNTPVAVAGGLVFDSLSAGGQRTCGLTAEGSAYCWGENYNGALGDGTTTNTTTPVPVAGGLTFAMVSADKNLNGGASSCGVTRSGVAYCWGYGYYGQLGDGTVFSESTVPVKVAGQP